MFPDQDGVEVQFDDSYFSRPQAVEDGIDDQAVMWSEVEVEIAGMAPRRLCLARLVQLVQPSLDGIGAVVSGIFEVFREAEGLHHAAAAQGENGAVEAGNPVLFAVLAAGQQQQRLGSRADPCSHGSVW